MEVRDRSDDRDRRGAEGYTMMEMGDRRARRGREERGKATREPRDMEKRLKKGDNIIFATFGGGFTWGAGYLKWAYDGE